MRHNKLLLTFLCLILGATGVIAQNDNFTITGTLPGAPDGAVVFLSNPNLSRDTLAVTRIHAGTFVLKGTIREPNLYFVTEDGQPAHKLFFLDASHLQLKAPANDLNQADVTVISGPGVQSDFRAFEPVFAPFLTRLGNAAQLVNEHKGEVQIEDSLLVGYRACLDTFDTMTQAYVKAHPASHVSAFLLMVHTQVRQDYDWLQTQFDLLSPPVQKDFYGRELLKDLSKAKIGKEGTMAIDFTENDVDGKPVSLSSFRGRYVLVDFWASWCGPCRMENPNVKRAYAAFKNKNFTILGVSLDQTREAWVRAIADDGLSWTQVSDLKYWNNVAAQLYDITSIPQNMLIDPSGKIIGRNLRGEALYERLQEVLK